MFAEYPLLETYATAGAARVALERCANTGPAGLLTGLLRSWKVDAHLDEPRPSKLRLKLSTGRVNGLNTVEGHLELVLERAGRLTLATPGIPHRLSGRKIAGSRALEIKVFASTART